MKTVDIFYKTYQKDFPWIKYSLASLAKNVIGYNKIIILVPKGQPFDTSNLPPRTQVHYINEYGDGYLFQQWCKISGHRFTHADFILFADSDCIFDHPINVQTFIEDERPEILYTHYSKVGNAQCWKQPTEAFIHEVVDFEFMRRNCLIYHRSTLEAIAGYCPELENMIMSSKRFSEFNAIGAYAFYNERHKYNFVNTDNWQYVEPKAIQLWSHADKNSQEENHKYEYKRAFETITSIIGTEPTDI